MASIATPDYTKPVKITPGKRRGLERACNNRLNWSDGGHWIGGGKDRKGKDCYIRENIRNKLSHTYHFPTDDSALRWNLDWEEKIRVAGHVVTATLTAVVGTTFTPAAGIAVGTLVAIAKDELQARVPYPRMARGWSFEIIYKHHFKWIPMNPHPSRGFLQTVTTVSRDFEENIVHSSAVRHRFKLEELPDGFARMLASKPPKKTESDY